MVYAGSEAATSHNLTTVDGYGCTVHVGEEVQDGEEHSLAASGSVCISFHTNIWERAANGCRGTVAEQIGRLTEQRADSREQIGSDGQSGGATATFTDSRAGRQAGSQPASMSQRQSQRQRQRQSQKPGLRMNLAAAAVL